MVRKKKINSKNELLSLYQLLTPPVQFMLKDERRTFSLELRVTLTSCDHERNWKSVNSYFLGPRYGDQLFVN